MTIIDQLRARFSTSFANEPDIIVRSPGRVNLIGEHIDYNGGTVLPTTIQNSIYIGFSKRTDEKICAEAFNLEKTATISIHHEEKSEQHWLNCLIGTIQLLPNPNKLPFGFNVLIDTDLPIGSGLSSSSALCCGLIKGIAELFNIQISKFQIAELAYKIEHDYIGIQCGFMDQFAICHGKLDQAMLFDTQTNTAEYLSIPKKNCEWYLIDSNVSRSLHDSAYNDRRSSCERIVEMANEHLGYVEFLVDLTLEDLNEIKPHLSRSEYPIGLFVIEEQQRVWSFAEALQNQDINSMGELLYQSQQGLAKHYAVSCWEIDSIIELCEKNTNIYGARMVGGGFGGCVLVLAKPNTDFSSILDQYNQDFELKADLIQLEFADAISSIR